MNGLILAIVTLLVLAPVASAISCYSYTGATLSSYSGYSSSGYDVCYSYTSGGNTVKSGLGSGSGAYTCASFTSLNSYSGYTCCATNLCNGAKINGVSILMASVAAMVALFRSM